MKILNKHISSSWFLNQKKNIIPVLKFLDIPAKNLWDTVDVLGYENLFFMCADTFFSNGENSFEQLIWILGQLCLLFFHCLNFTVTHWSGWMLVAFFVGQLFQETVEESLQSEMLIVNMFEEFLKLFCKGSKKRSERKTSRIYHNLRYLPQLF